LIHLPRRVAARGAAPPGPARRCAAAGERVIGLLGSDIPTELVAASGALALQLPAMADQPTPDADRYVETVFSPTARSVAQQWLEGDLDFLDTVVMSRANDSAQRLYYYVCELRRRRLTAGPRLLIYDLSKIPRPASLTHTLQATERLAQQLGARRDALAAAITQRNRRRAAFAALSAQRSTPAPPLGSTVARLSRASDLCTADILDAALAAWLKETRAAGTGPRLLLAGSAPPDERLHVLIESAGGCVVGEAGEHSLARLGSAVDNSDDPLRSLAAHYHELPYGPRAFADRAADIAQQVGRCRAQGVILWVIEEDESMVWDLPGITRTLGDARVPLLALSRRRWDARDDTGERIAAFVASLQVSP